MSSTQRDALRVAGIGAGYFSGFHYEAWRRVDGAKLVAVADLNIDAAIARAGEACAYDNVDAMLEKTRPDIVDIVTPPAAHLDLIEKAFDSGASAVICQKPFCAGLAGATKAVEIAERYGKPLIVHENFRFQPWYRSIKAALDQDRCGKLRQISFRLRPGDGKGPRAYLDRQPYFQRMPKFLIHETGVHWIDTYRYLLGDPDEVYADLRRLNPAIDGEDAGFFIFSYKDGRRALFDGNRLVDHLAEDRRRTMGECLVEGDEAVLLLSGDGDIMIRGHGDREWRLFEAFTATKGFAGDSVHAFQNHVVAALRDGAPLETEAASYLAVLRLEEALYRSAETGARVQIERTVT